MPLRGSLPPECRKNSLARRMVVELRQERREDFRQTERVVREAFWNCYEPGCCEHWLLHVMRDVPAFVAELHTVAVEAERIVGQVACVRGTIIADDGAAWEVLTLGPIAVLPDYQKRGIGRRLVEYTCRLAEQARYRAIVLCGDPDWYEPMGFVPAERFGICTADGWYADALQVYELRDKALQGVSGRYVEDAVYRIDPDEVARFDREFTIKTPESGTPSQLKFRELVARRRKVDR